MEEKIEYYTLKPNLKQIYGKKVTKDTVFTEKTEDGRVTQEFKDLTLTTRIKSEMEQGGFKIVEESTMTVTMPEGTILIWNEQEGFIVPQYQMCTLEELEEEIKDIKGIYNEEQ
ncbi:MAG: hypothetical protein IJ272_08150 [Clostridia bacterium]|nr:hypothetical protein [Clostridia bacterium]